MGGYQLGIPGTYPYAACHPYGSLNLTDSSPVQSFVEPISLEQARSYLNVPDRDPEDIEEDSLIQAYISAAREIAEVEQGRDLVRKQFDLSLDSFFSYRIELRDPLVSVDLVRRRDSSGTYMTMGDGTDYIVNTTDHPGFITPPYNVSWPTFTPWPTGAVLVRFTSGFSADNAFWNDAGKRIKAGMFMLISGWFNNRLPYAIARSIQEYPYGVTALLQYGGLRRGR